MNADKRGWSEMDHICGTDRLLGPLPQGYPLEDERNLWDNE